MDRPSVLVVRETSSLADSIQLLLETVGFRVISEGRVDLALARLSADGAAFRAVVIACNQPRSEMLHAFPEAFPASARTLPVLVVGDRAAGSRHGWPSNVHFVRLPLEARELLELLDLITGGPAVERTAPASGGLAR